MIPAPSERMGMAHILKRSDFPGDGETTWLIGGDTVFIDEGENEPVLPSLRVSVELDRTDEARPRAVSTRLSSARETLPKLVKGGIAPTAGTVPAARVREIAEVMDAAFPKILRAEETGDPVSDLNEALC
jgi:hypothetical protein